MKTANKNVSSTFHTSRTRVESSRIAHNKKVDRIKRDTAQTVILGVILASMLVVIVGVLIFIFNKPERQVVNKVESLAKDYYEKAIYEPMEKSNPSSYKTSLKRYSETGFSPVALRRLLLFKSPTATKESKYLTNYCDENNTYVIYYPTEPYGEKDYRIDYHYTCTF